MFSNYLPVSFGLSSSTEVTKHATEAYYSYLNSDYENMNALITLQPFDPFCYSNVDVTFICLQLER